MKPFGTLYLDKEKDIIVSLKMDGEKLFYVLRTPNHGTGNLISNLAAVCGLPVSFDENGLKQICGEIPCYVDGENRRVYILRLADTKVANIYPDGQIERRAAIPAIAKTLMSQTKEYELDRNKTLVKTYIREKLKFRSDLHSHRSGNLSPDLLIALGIHHQLRYPYYYIKKLGLRLSEEQQRLMEAGRRATEERLGDTDLKGKYRERLFDDNTFINFAALMLNEHSAYNIPRVRASLAVLKDGQAVFTDLEKVYLYRYVFTKGMPADDRIELKDIDSLPDADIIAALRQMEMDRNHPVFGKNTLYQDTLLWVARSYRRSGVHYAEISDTALVKESEAAETLAQIHTVMPAVTAETGVTLRFLAALRRIPLLMGHTGGMPDNSYAENLRVLRAVAGDPYVAGSDFVGEEMNDIRELQPVMNAVLRIAREHPSFVVRIHAGENDALPDNVLNSLLSVEKALLPGQAFPHVRIGHGLYTANLKSEKGRALLELLRRRQAVLEFQITSNVRLNNLSRLNRHPLRQYLNAGIYCVQGTDGGALYGTDSIDEQLSLERMLELTDEELLRMRQAEKEIIDRSMREFEQKKTAFRAQCTEGAEAAFYRERILQDTGTVLLFDTGRLASADALKEQIAPLPQDRVPVVIAGGSFNNAVRRTRLREADCRLLDDLLKRARSGKFFVVIGPSLGGYERYILDKAGADLPVFAFVPAQISEAERMRLEKSGVKVRVALECSPQGVYKSVAYEIFKRRPSVIIALDGNAAASNLIQDAKNSRYLSRTFIGASSRALRAKAASLQGYVTLLDDWDTAESIAAYVDYYYDLLKKPVSESLKKPGSRKT